MAYIWGMDGKASEIETAQAVADLGAGYMHRLRKLVEGLVTDLERIAQNKADSDAVAGQRARILLGACKVVKLFFPETAQEEAEMNGDFDAGGIDAVDAWKVVLERKLLELARRKRDTRARGEPDGRGPAVGADMGVLGGAGADPAGR